MNEYQIVLLGSLQESWAGAGPGRVGHTPCLHICTERLKEEKPFTSTFWNVSFPKKSSPMPSSVVQQNESFCITIAFKETNMD